MNQSQQSCAQSGKTLVRRRIISVPAKGPSDERRSSPVKPADDFPGALDVLFTPVQMKKHRPGVLLSILCAAAEADRFTEMILRETSAFGVRRSALKRRKLHREFQPAKTPWGEVTIELGRLGQEVVQAAPEYESCRSLAARAGIPTRLVFESARAAARNLLTTRPPH
jgi:uncharacterized protein (DUF111 family)